MYLHCAPHGHWPNCKNLPPFHVAPTIEKEKKKKGKSVKRKEKHDRLAAGRLVLCLRRSAGGVSLPARLGLITCRVRPGCPRLLHTASLGPSWGMSAFSSLSEELTTLYTKPRTHHLEGFCCGGGSLGKKIDIHCIFKRICWVFVVFFVVVVILSPELNYPRTALSWGK